MGVTTAQDGLVSGARFGQGGTPAVQRDRGRRPADAAAGALLVVAGVCVSACSSQELSILAPAGEGARSSAGLWWLMLALGTAVFVVVVVLLVVALFSGGRPSGRRDMAWIVAGGVALPLLILIPLSVVTTITGVELTRHPDAEQNLTVEVIGHKWWWEVRYPDAGLVTANEIHIPAGTPVTMRLSSSDVIHSFWVPRLHGKLDMVPGVFNELVMSADRPGVYRGQCAEYCGLQHARMAMLVVAQSPAEFERWLADSTRPAADPVGALAQRGRAVFAEAGCADCHNVQGTEFDGDLGPDLTRVAVRRTLAAAQMPNTRGAMAGWIVDPQATKPGALMPPTRLAPDDLQALLAYLEQLR